MEIENPFYFRIKLAIGEEVIVDLVETFNLIKPVYVRKIFERELSGRKYIFIDGGRIGVVWKTGETSCNGDEEKFIKENMPGYEDKKEIFINGILGCPQNFYSIKNPKNPYFDNYSHNCYFQFYKLVK